jgi:cytochrome c553
MKAISLKLAMQTAMAILALLFAAPGRAEDAPVVPQRDIQAKIQYCKTCHGLSGQGYRGDSPMPRLAGQQSAYFEDQLRAFGEEKRSNKFMHKVADVLSPEMLAALAAHFRDLNPKPLGGAPRDLVAAGKEIYEKGVPAADVPPCASCHGPEAKGDAANPRLAGQLHDYTLRKLVNWSKERGQDPAKDPAKPDASAVKQPKAHVLTESQSAAVAAYLSYQE